MSKLLINIRGTNGSGKSTVPIQMYNLDDSKYELGDKGRMITVYPKFKFITVGTYHNKTGGMDTIDNNADTMAAVHLALEKGEELGYDVIMEGIMSSTVKSTYLNLFKEVQQTTNFKPVVLFYNPPFELCLERIYRRNGGKAIREGLVANKYKAIANQPPYFRENGIEAHVVDNSKLTPEGLLHAFLRAIEKWR
jgi:predicted ABC-type ATPase